MKNKRVYLGLGLLLISLIGLTVLDAPLWNHQTLTVMAPKGEPLAATYYPGTSARGVLLLEGFGSDQHMLHSLVRDLLASGVHVFTFDYSGHGYSPGALEYDNASTERLAGQVQAAMCEFQRVSGLSDDQIIWMGHSLGARVALQHAVLSPFKPAKLVLIGAQVNLGTNAQSEFFTGTTDASLAWVQSLGPITPDIPILLLSGKWEDILTVQGAQLLMTKLCGTETQTCTNRQWLLYDRLVHNYEVYSPRVISAAIRWAFPGHTFISSLAGWRIVGWLGVVLGIFVTLISALRILPVTAPRLNGIAVINIKKLLWGKLALWLVALPLSAGVMFLYVLIPLPSPTFNLIYGGFLGGYGLLMFVLYWFGRVPGLAGSLRSLKQDNINAPQWGWAIVFNMALFVIVTLLFRSGLGLVPPMGVRFIWVVIFVPLSALGFRLGMIEADALAVAAPDRSIYRFVAALIGLVPFYLYLILLAALGSTSGVLGALTGLCVLAMSLLQGEVTRRLTGHGWIAALLQAVLIYWLILPAGALFTPLF